MKGSELKQGVKVEKEHTSDPKEAEKIAQDHLKEDPSYYSKLKVSGLADELDETEQEKKVKKLLDAYHQIAKVRLGKQPSIEDVISLMAEDLEKRSSDEIAESLDKNSQKDDSQKIKIVEHPKDVIDVDPNIIKDMKDRLSDTKMEKAEEDEESIDIPSILMYTIFYGMSEKEGGSKSPDESKILYYKTPDDLYYDCSKQSWLFEKPEMLDHLPSREIQNNDTDVLHAILHGVIEDDDFNALDNAGLVNPTAKTLFEKLKQKSDLDKTNGIGEISPAPPTPPAPVYPGPVSPMAMSEEESGEELEKSLEDDNLDEIYDAYQTTAVQDSVSDFEDLLEGDDFIHEIKSAFEQIIDGAFSDPDDNLRVKIREIVREEMKKM